MIYKYSTGEIFKTNIDFTVIAAEIDKNKTILNNIIGIDTYLNNWKKALINSYKKEENKTFNFKNINSYYTSIIINNFELRIHFNIDIAINLAKNNLIYKIPLTEFATNIEDNPSATIKYYKYQSISSYNYGDCDIPIIIVSYYVDNFYYIVIDGNHRVTAKVNNRNSYVRTILLPLEDTISSICSNFERALYLFYYEGQNVNYFIKNSNSKLFL